MSAYKDIFEAAEKGTVEDVRFFIEQLGVSANSTDSAGNTPMHKAAYVGNIGVLEYLVSQGADVNAVDKSGWTPLVYSLWRVSESIPQCTDIRGKTCKKVEAILAYLVSQGADVNAKTHAGGTPLHFGAKLESVRISELLISQGANINAKDSEGTTPLHQAAEGNNNIDVVRFLVAKGADINAKDNKGNTPLNYANSNVHCYRGDAKEIKRYNTAQAIQKFLRDAGAQGGSGGKQGCLVFLAALGTLLTSGICGLALFATMAWKF